MICCARSTSASGGLTSDVCRASADSVVCERSRRLPTRKTRLLRRAIGSVRDAVCPDVALLTLRGVVRSRAALHLEVLALRHQLQVLERSRPRRLRLTNADRWLRAWLSRSWIAWRTPLVIVKPE